MAFTSPGASARELPVYSWSEWDSVSQVKVAITAMEAGAFDQSSQIIDAMGRDDRISGCMLTRAGALPALPVSFEPRGDGRMKKAVAKEVEETFDEMFPDHALTELMHWGIFQGLGIGQLRWTFTERTWKPKLNVWHPRYTYWRWDTESLWVSAVDGPVEVKPGDGQWVVYAPYGLRRGWMYGKVRSLYVPWLIRQWGMRDFARYSEVHGMPIRKAVTPAGAEKEDKERFLREVANLGQESVIRTPRVPSQGSEDKDARFDIELVEAVARSEEAFDKLLAMANTNVAIAILGQNLSTEVKGGSYAATMGHLQIRADVLQADAEKLGECLRTQALGPYCQVNYGSSLVAPLPKWQTKPPEDKVAKGQAIKNLGEGIAALKRVGAKPDVDKLLEADEIPFTGPAEEVDINALENPVPAPAEPPAGGNAPKASKLKRPVARASQEEEDELPDALVEGQLYTDELTANGTKAAAKALKPDLRVVLELVEKAESFEQLRDGLTKAYAKMSRKKLAKLLKHAVLLSELAGREAVLEEGKE